MGQPEATANAEVRLPANDECGGWQMGGVVRVDR